MNKEQSANRMIPLLLLVMCLYGSLYIANKYVVNVLDPPLILLLRYAISSVFLIPLTIFRLKKNGSGHDLSADGNSAADESADPRDRSGRITVKGAVPVCLIGILGYAGGVGAQLLGTKYAGAATASVINAMNPIAITILAAILLKERLVWYRILAVCLAVAGAVLIVSGGSGVETTGIWWSVLAVVLWSLMSVFIRRFSQQYDPMTVTTMCMASAAVVLLVVVIITNRSSLLSLTGVQWAAILYISIACTAVAHTLWNYCLSRLDASFCSMFYPVQPLVSTILAAVILHEIIKPTLLAGGVLIIIGLLVALLMERRKAQKQSC